MFNLQKFNTNILLQKRIEVTVVLVKAWEADLPPIQTILKLKEALEKAQQQTGDQKICITCKYNKCEQYWPLDKQLKTFGDITVCSKSVECWADFTQTRLSISKDDQTKLCHTSTTCHGLIMEYLMIYLLMLPFTSRSNHLFHVRQALFSFTAVLVLAEQARILLWNI
ncbi:hypothetical protein EB796_011227 [Bugula neritina]|uniref:Uncharacterized protein n=1 Tax=Bugula neritina TaxID=10212 RepID=A0A7J7JWY4_BUGNE|nr:hypothetical protein EB796_011227 [Bugula neritina]